MSDKEKIINYLENSFYELEKAKKIIDECETLSIWELNNKSEEFCLDKFYYSLMKTVKKMKISLIEEKWG